jgi:riboflavin synthase alpha subunit
MFTGIIEELGTVITAGTRLSIRCSTILSDASLGASIAVMRSGLRTFCRDIHASAASIMLRPSSPPSSSPRRRRTAAA